MSRLATIGLALLLATTSGCVARLPTRAEVRNSELAYASLAKAPIGPGAQPLGQYAADRTVLLIDGPNWTVLWNRDGSATFRTPGDAASAGVFITGDGYLLASGHGVTGRRTLAILPGWADGAIRGHSARVVWSGYGAKVPIDVAILKINLTGREPSVPHLPLSALSHPLPGVGTPLLMTGIAPDVGEDLPVLVQSAGRLVGSQSVGGVGHVDVAAPVRPGFSGGPALDPYGNLAGITIQLSSRSALRGVFPLPRFEPTFETRLVRLDPEFVAGVIRRDRIANGQ